MRRSCVDSIIVRPKSQAGNFWDYAFDTVKSGRLPMNLLGASASRRPVGSRKPELAGETPTLPGTVPRFEGVGQNDSSETARNAWRKAKSNLLEVVSEAENARRLLAIPELRDDVAFCLQQDKYPLIAQMEAGTVIRMLR